MGTKNEIERIGGRGKGLEEGGAVGGGENETEDEGVAFGNEEYDRRRREGGRNRRKGEGGDRGSRPAMAQNDGPEFVAEFEV